MKKLILLIALLLLVSCDYDRYPDTKVLVQTVEYDIIVIEGMTCLRFQAGYQYALTCNWEEWSSENLSPMPEEEETSYQIRAGAFSL